MNVTEKVKGISHKKRLFIAAVLILGTGIAGGAVYASQSQQKMNEAQAAVDKQYTTLQRLEKEIQLLFDEKDPAFLAKDVTADQIEGLKVTIKDSMEKYSTIDYDLEKLDTKAFKKNMTTAEEHLETAAYKFDIQVAVNALFSDKEKFGLTGSVINKDLAIADITDEAAVNSVKEMLDETSDSNFNQAILLLVDVAEGQLKQISTAKTAVLKVYKDKVISTDQKSYDAAKKEVDKIKNEKAKKSLSDQLAKVKAEIDKKAKEAEEKKKKESEEAKAAIQTDDVVAADQANTQQAPEASVADQTNGQSAGNDNATNNYANNGSYAGNQGNDTGSYTPPATGGSNTGSTGGGSTGTGNGNSQSGGGNTDGGGGVSPAPEPEIPYPLLNVGGTPYLSYSDAEAAGIASGSRYKVYTVPYSDGSTKYHLVIL